MKKLGILFLLMTVLALSAHADWIDNCDSSAVCEATMGTLAFTASPFLLTTFVVGAAVSGFDGKAEYVAAVKDDAAEYVAEGDAGEASALLKSEIDHIRAEHPETAKLNDSQIAQGILVAN